MQQVFFYLGYFLNYFLSFASGGPIKKNTPSQSSHWKGDKPQLLLRMTISAGLFYYFEPLEANGHPISFSSLVTLTCSYSSLKFLPCIIACGILFLALSISDLDLDSVC